MLKFTDKFEAYWLVGKNEYLAYNRYSGSILKHCELVLFSV